MQKKALVVSALAGFVSGFLQNDIRILKDMGYEVHCAGNASNKNQEENRSNFEDIGTQFHQIDFSSNSPLSRQSLRAYKQVKKLLKQYEFDVIHCHTPIAGAVVRVAAQPYRVSRGCRVIYTSHGFYFHKGSSKKTWIIYYTIEKIMTIFSDAIITINNEDYQVAKKMWAKKVYHINGVGCNTEKYNNITVNRKEYRKKLGIPEGAIMILDIGELSVRKNHKVIIDAIAELKRDDIYLVICGKAISGQGTYDSLKETAEKKNVNVVFAGHRHDIPEICKCADFGALASIREGLGMAGIEMMSSGLPLITSNVHGIKDYMIDGETGYMCNPYDVHAFSEGISQLCNYNNRVKMKRHCIESAKRFDKSVSISQMKKIYSEVLE